MAPLKDNKPWRRILCVLAGLAYDVWAVVAICKGHIAAGRYREFNFYAAKNPAKFWLTVALFFGLGVWLIVRGIRGRK
jgi:hypothetical protein